MPSYKNDQTVFTLSMLANLGSAITGTVEHIEAALSNTINTQLLNFRPQIGTWTVVWGPAVHLAPRSIRADNVMYVAQAGSDTDNPGQLVIAIAGTNPYSPFDWLLEDALVLFLQPWETGTPPAGSDRRISFGSAIGLRILQRLIPEQRLPGAGTLVTEFLATALQGINSVTVTGHSLGGALAPLYALFLLETQGNWDSEMQAQIACFASAGPTPGNRDFAAYYESQLGRTTTRFWNTLDVVPHVWNVEDIGKIPNLYDDPTQAPDSVIPPDPLVPLLADAAHNLLLPLGYTHITPAVGHEGVFNHNLDVFDPGAGNFSNYFKQMIYQHVDSYAVLLKVPEVGKLLKEFAPSLTAVSLQPTLAALRLALQRRLLLLTVLHNPN